MDAFGVTHKGKVRKHNEDTIYLTENETPVIAIVADGMGGHHAGQVASSMAVGFVCAELKRRSVARINAADLKAILPEVSKRLYALAENDAELYQMGTTLTMAICKKGSVVIGHIGDSRAYRYYAGNLTRLTKDHSYVQYLVEQKLLTPEEAENHPYRSIITRAVGQQEVEADATEVTFFPNDVILLCSDGLTTHVRDKEIKKILAEGESAEKTVQKLLSLALERGGRDNISVILIRNDGGRP